MSTPIFSYEKMVQNALLGVVKKVLEEINKNGLQGDHHFYLTFRTDHPKVSMPSYLMEAYKEEMTIILQHQFWDLDVYDKGFSVSLSFNDVPESLYIPFTAIINFVDPSVRFGLQFEADFEEDDEEEVETKEKTKKSKKTTSKNTTTDTSNNVVQLDAFRNKH